MATWEHHRDSGGHFHTLAIEGVSAYVKVEKSRGGDYFITAVLDDDSSGGDVEYRDTLAQAKRFAEGLVSSGTWVEYTQDPAAAIAACRL